MKCLTIKFYLIFVICLLLMQLVCAQAPYGIAGDHTPVKLEITNAPFGYYEYLPVNYNPASGDKYPVILFYHGYGERGNGNSDLSKVLVHGPPMLIEKGRDFPAIVISPQTSGGWSGDAGFLKMYNYLKENYPIDLDRFYITGLSSGGGGTWNALKAHYTKIAAAIPICGTAFLPGPSEFLQSTPIWLHHNFKDSIGKLQSINNVDEIANSGVSVMETYPYRVKRSVNSVANGNYTMQFDIELKVWYSKKGINKPENKMAFTMYKKGGHNSWAKTYRNKDVWEWLFAQSLSQH